MRKQLISLIFLIICMLCGLFSYSQNYFFDIYSVKDGLSQSTVFTTLQDKDGFLWLGTEIGVSRFDGNEFINYSSSDGLAENGVRAIIQDSNNKIWCAHTGGGLSRISNQKFESVPKTLLNIQNDITSIVEDDQKNIWIGTKGDGAFLISNPNEPDLNKLKFKQFKGSEQLSDRVYGLYKTRSGDIYFILDGSIKYKNPNKANFELFKPDGLFYYFQFITLFEDSQGTLWFGSYNGGLYQYKKNKAFTYYDLKTGLSSNWITQIAEDKNGSIWVGTWGGGINVITGTTIKQITPKNGIPDIKIRSIISDREGNIIIGTNESGMAIFKGETFTHYNEKHALLHPQVWSVAEDDAQKMWFGTNGGISILDQKTGEFQNLTAENSALVSNQIRFLKKDNLGNMWVGTADYGMMTFAPNAKRCSYNFTINSNFPNSSQMVTALDVDKNNHVWIGTIDGLLEYDLNTDGIKHYTQQDGLLGNEISAIYCAHNNEIWIGTRAKGIVIYSNGKFTKLEYNQAFTPTSITESKDRSIWIGTDSKGILVCSGKKVVKTINPTDGLLSEYVTMLLSDHSDKVYIGSNQGINIYEISSGKIYRYNEKDGFVGIEVKNNAAFMDQNNDVWFGTVKGVIKLKTSAYRKNLLEPLTHIKRMRVNFKDKEMSDGMKLSYNENSIIFDYNSICLTNPDNVLYQIILKGADADWRPLTKETYINYSALSPGHYEFLVKACNNEGVWNKSPISFKFHIAPPFWKTWWFYFILLISATAGIISYIKLRERKLRIEKRILEQLVNERTAEISLKNAELATKNRDITDSIRYAKRIQDALLPDKEYIRTIIPDYFIFYKPRDIVSGDFYWVNKKDSTIYIAAADCTGHGVPGAFMSMLGITFLNEIASNNTAHSAADVLNQLRDQIIKSLKQSGKPGDTQDGMDISLIIIHTNESKIEFAGANNSLFLMKGSELIQLKADKMPIGIYSRGLTPFTNHEVMFSKNDLVYLYSDGYVDQFGGPNEAKFLTRSLKEIIQTMGDRTMEEQKHIVEEKFESWKGDLEQTDDVLVFGIRF